MNHKSNSLFASFLVISFAANANAGEVIAHPSVALSADEVKELFLGDKQFAGNVKLVPADNSAAQADFVAKVLQTDVAKYSARWAKKAFREGLNAPGVKSDDADVLAFVKATPGAVGYVSGASGGAKVLLKY
jgi:hypothetical protein